MRLSPTLFPAAFLLLFPGVIHATQEHDNLRSRDLGKIQPPGGVPLDYGRPGTPIKVDAVEKAKKRLESAPLAGSSNWNG